MKNYISPAYAVCALIYHPNNKDLILGVTRKDDHNDWGLIGGKVDPGETAVDALVRETKEETDLDLIYWKYVFARYEEDNLVVTYLCRAANHSRFKSNEAGRVDWIDRDQLNKGKFGAYNKALFQTLDNHQYFEYTEPTIKTFFPR